MAFERLERHVGSLDNGVLNKRVRLCRREEFVSSLDDGNKM
jgi:hypothetical protein